MVKYNIVLPHPKYLVHRANKRCASHSACLWSLNGISGVKVSYGAFDCPHRLHTNGIADNNAKFGGYFSINDNIFLILDTDKPHLNLKRWVNYYGNKNIKGFFLSSYYKDLKPVFDESNMSVFPYWIVTHFGVPFLNDDKLTKNLPNIDKDISVFFKGKFKNNSKRHSLSQLVENKIPDCYIHNSDGAGYVDEKTYFNLLQRSKIVWSPPSIPSKDSSQSALYVREKEAMCMGALCARYPIDVFTPKEVVSGEHFAEIKKDDSNLIEVLEKYLSDDKERLRIAKNGRLFFEENFTCLAVAKYVLEKCISVI